MNKKAIDLIPSISKESLRNRVEQLVHKDEMSYAEAICEICESMLIDPEDIARLVTGPLRVKLEAEAISKNIIPHTTLSLF